MVPNMQSEDPAGSEHLLIWGFAKVFTGFVTVTTP